MKPQNRAFVGALIVLGTIAGIYTIASATEPTPLSAVLCPTGADLLVHPGGTWDCGTTPSPTASPTPSPTQTPTPAPTTPTPAPTMPSPSPSTTTAPPTPTASPTPSPTTAARLTNCMTRLDACGYPSPTTTGVPASVTLQPYLGPLRISAANAVIDGKNLPCLEIAAANVTIRNSKITGPCFWGLNVTSGSLRLENSTVDCVNYQGTGIGGGHWTVLRSQLLRCENGADVAGGNNTIQDSYIADVREVNGGHGDGIQAYTAGGVLRNVTVRHTTFALQQPITSSLIMGYPAENLLVEDNFFAAGSYEVYCPNNQPITNVIYRNNRFAGTPLKHFWQAGNDPYSPSFGYSDGCVDPGITWFGNYRDSDLGAVAAA